MERRSGWGIKFYRRSFSGTRFYTEFYDNVDVEALWKKSKTFVNPTCIKRRRFNLLGALFFYSVTNRYPIPFTVIIWRAGSFFRYPLILVIYTSSVLELKKESLPHNTFNISLRSITLSRFSYSRRSNSLSLKDNLFFFTGIGQGLAIGVE